MKKVSKSILTIVVSLLVLAVPVAVACGILSHNGTISLNEARVLINNVCKAVVHDNTELSTASTDNEGYYPYNYVRLKDTGTEHLQFLYMIKFALDDGKGTEDYLYAINSLNNGKFYFGYKLTSNGLIGDFVVEGIGSSPDHRGYVELGWNNDEKNEWKLDILFSEVAEEFEKYGAEVNDFSATRYIVIGTEEAANKAECFFIRPSKSLYYDLTRADINQAGYFLMDTVSKKMVYKDTDKVGVTDERYKNRNGEQIAIEDFTDEEIMNTLASIQTYFKNSWTPKIMLKKCKESDFVNKTQETLTPIHNQLYGA